LNLVMRSGELMKRPWLRKDQLSLHAWELIRNQWQFRKKSEMPSP